MPDDPHPDRMTTLAIGREIVRLDREAAAAADRLDAIRDRLKLLKQFMAGRVRDLPTVPDRQALQVDQVAFWSEGSRLEWRELVRPAEPLPPAAEAAALPEEEDDR